MDLLDGCILDWVHESIGKYKGGKIMTSYTLRINNPNSVSSERDTNSFVTDEMAAEIEKATWKVLFAYRTKEVKK